MVMPFCQDGSLTAWLKQRSNLAILSPLDVVPIVQQAADALQYAHDRHIIHRDVKPSNFLTRHNQENPNRPYLLLADFGLARLSSASISKSLTIGGTPPYMAPEQWRGYPVPATDQYMLAVMAYELLTGRTPFRGGLERLMFQHMQEQPEPPSRFNPQIPIALNSVVLQALAKEPEARFPSVSAFARAFQEALQEGPQLQANDSYVAGETNATRPPPASNSPPISPREPQHLLSGSAATRKGWSAPSEQPVISSREDHSPRRGLNINFAASKRVIIYGGTLILALLVIVSSIAYFGIFNRPASSSLTATPAATSPARAHLTATAQSIATATAAQSIYKQATSGTPALNNSLSQANNSFPTNTSCVFTGGTYLVTAASGDYWTCSGGPSFTNFAFEVQMTVLKGDCGGIMFRTNAAAGKYYVFEVCASGDYGVFLYFSPRATDYHILRLSNSPAVKTGLNQTNAIAVVANGKNFYLYVNRQAIDSFSDSSYNSGQTGFVADGSSVFGGSAASTDVAYNYQKVWTF